MKNKIFLTAAASLLALSISTGASALPAPIGYIDGSLGYSTLSGATTWSYDNVLNSLTVGEGEVDYVSGDLASTISLNDNVVALAPFTYDMFVPSTTIWSLGGFTFNLDSVTSYIEITSTDLYLLGMGTVSSAGFLDTTMSWTFSGNQFTFGASSVPEPSVMALFGLGLLGLGLARRKIRS